MQSNDRVSSDNLVDEPSSDLSAEIAQLRQDFASLKNDLSSFTASAKAEATSKLHDTVESAKEHAAEAIDEGATELKEIQRQTERAVRKNPLTAMAAALAIGYFIAGISRR